MSLNNFEDWPAPFQIFVAVGAIITGAVIWLRSNLGGNIKPPDPIPAVHPHVEKQLADLRQRWDTREILDGIEHRIRSDIKSLELKYDAEMGNIQAQLENIRSQVNRLESEINKR